MIRACICAALLLAAAAAQEPATPRYTPQPDDAKLMRGRAFVDRSAVAGGKLSVAGNLPTPCHQLRLEIPAAPDATGTLAIEAYSVFDRGTICAQVLQPFSVEAPLTAAQAAANITINGTPAGPPTR